MEQIYENSLQIKGGSMINTNEIRKCIIEGDINNVIGLTKSAMLAGISAKQILDQGIIPGLGEVGDLFEKGEYFLPELIVSGEAASKAVEYLEPVLRKGNTLKAGKFLIGTVQGDVHDIGKNIVIMMLRGNGWEVEDLGVDVSPEEFCSAIDKDDFDILGMSSLLTTTMSKISITIEALKTAGLREKIKIMVGGAPLTQDWANMVGADGYAQDASTAVKIAVAMVGKS